MDLFVYGSLLAAEVVDRILGAGASARLEWTPARLEGFERRTVRGQRYPGVVACAGAHVDGAVIRGLTDSQLKSLDDYEGDEFRRLDVSVVTASGATLAAITYAWAMAEDRLDGPWSYERFREQLPQYMGLAVPAAGDAPTYAFFSTTPAS